MGAVAPLLLIGGAAAASTVQKNAAAAAQQRMFEANRINAGNAAISESETSNIDTARQEKAIAGKGMDIALKALRTQASQAVSGSESGLAGGSVDLAIMDTHADQLRSQTALSEQASQIYFNNLLSAKGIKTATQSRINSVAQGTSTTFFKELVGTAMSYGVQKWANSGAKSLEIPTEKPIINNINEPFSDTFVPLDTGKQKLNE